MNLKHTNMKKLEFNFNEGKQRVITLLEEHLESVIEDMKQSIKTMVDDDTDIPSIKETIESIEMYSEVINLTISKVNDATNIYELLKATDDSPFEDLEETVLCELFGLEDMTIK